MKQQTLNYHDIASISTQQVVYVYVYYIHIRISICIL